MNSSPAAVIIGFFAKATGLVAAAILGGSLTARAAEISARPNIIFILADDVRWDALSCMGHSVDSEY